MGIPTRFRGFGMRLFSSPGQGPFYAVSLTARRLEWVDSQDSLGCSPL